jgi:hypothetical protein
MRFFIFKILKKIIWVTDEPFKESVEYIVWNVVVGDDRIRKVEGPSDCPAA